MLSNNIYLTLFRRNNNDDDDDGCTLGVLQCNLIIADLISPLLLS